MKVTRGSVAALPGVVGVGGINHLPMGDGRSHGSMQIEDYPTEEGGMPPLAERKTVVAGYFETMGIPLLQGRYLNDSDGIDGARAVVVSAGFAQHWWPSESALGRRVKGGNRSDEEVEDEGWYQIVGIVGDVHFAALEDPAEETVYYPTLAGSPEMSVTSGVMELVVQVDGDPTELVAPVRSVMRQIDPALPIAKSRPVAEVLADSMARTSFTLVMLGAASSVALLLGAIGIYGVISFVVSQRTQEIGVRIALGASSGTVQSMVVRRGMILATIGILVGIAAALGTSSVLASLLYGVSALDPATYIAVTAALATVALMASWLPAMRASSIDPVEALRAD